MSRSSIFQFAVITAALVMLFACQKKQQTVSMDAPSAKADAVEIFLRISAGYSTPQGQYVSRSPLFVMYESGRVIFNRSGNYFEGQLSAEEKSALLAELEALKLDQITDEKLAQEEKTLDYPVFLSDAGNTILGYRHGDQMRIVTANGLTVKAKNYQKLETWQNLARINDRLANFKHEGAQPYSGPVAVCFLKAPSKIMAAGAPVLSWPLAAISPAVQENLPASPEQEMSVTNKDLGGKLMEMNGKIYEKDGQFFTVYSRIAPPGGQQTRQWGRM